MLKRSERASRSTRIILRVSPAEKALVEERAKAAGLKVSEFIRREAGIGDFGRADLRRGTEKADEHRLVPVSGWEGETKPLPVPTDDTEARERAREQARAALASLN